MKLYERIRQRREELGMSQDELAEKLGYKSRSTIAKIESGENDITQSKIVAFAHALETSPSYLMGWSKQIDCDSDDGSSNKCKSYYNNPETAKLAQELYDNPDRRVLLDATRDLRPEDVKALTYIINQMKKKDGSD